MQPRVTKRERRLHLSYELPHRVHCSQIYPIQAPNGSTVIIYGHDSGITVLWRGGRRRRARETASSLPAPTPNGVPASVEMIPLDDDANGDEPARVGVPKTRATDAAQYEDEEEELDPDAPYPPVIEDLNIYMHTDVLHIAVPALSPSVTAIAPEMLRSDALVTVAYANGTVRMIRLPLEPPLATEKDAVVASLNAFTVELSKPGPLPSAVAMKIVDLAPQSTSLAESRLQSRQGAVLIAAATQSLKVWQVDIDDGELLEPERQQYTGQYLPTAVSKLDFHPLSRSGQLLVADVTGSVRIYDPFSAHAARPRPTSSESMLDFNSKSSPNGSWAMTYHTSFQETKDAPDGAPSLARRKKALDAKWIMTGKAILALLEDGEWGIWEASSSSKSSKRVDEFHFRGFLGSSASSANTTENTKPKKTVSKLAPMTPNTRRVKAESLFSGAPKIAGVASTGGISVAATTSNPRPGQADESVALWYNGDVYAIASMHAFWQRSTSNSTGGGGGFGSLYAPGLAHLPDLNLMNENITSLSQFVPKAPITGGGGLGQLNFTRDLLISAERRLVILQTLRPATPPRVLFQQAMTAVERRPPSRDTDQAMLDAGELDIGAMDRILDDMAAGGNGRTRKVGFAH